MNSQILEAYREGQLLTGEALEFAINELGVPCKTRNCGKKVDGRYTENQVGSRCDKCLSEIGK